jgi:hypothetical protein
MPSYLAKTDIPKDKRDVVHLLFLVDDDLAALNPKQIAAIREIYHLNNDLTVEQLIREEENKGFVLTDGIEDETKVNNKFQRGGRP